MKCPLNECKNGCHCLSRYYLLGVTIIAGLIIWLGGFKQSLFLAINSKCLSIKFPLKGFFSEGYQDGIAKMCILNIKRLL